MPVGVGSQLGPAGEFCSAPWQTPVVITDGTKKGESLPSLLTASTSLPPAAAISMKPGPLRSIRKYGFDTASSGTPFGLNWVWLSGLYFSSKAYGSANLLGLANGLAT